MTKDAGLVRDVFNEEKKIDTPGSVGIGHTRYSTAGMDDVESLKKNAVEPYAAFRSIYIQHRNKKVNE